MNIVLINLYDSLPDEDFVSGRYTYLSTWLSKSGHYVKWISSSFFHAAKKYRENCGISNYKFKGVEVCKIWAPPYYKNIGISRLYNDYYLSKKIVNELRNSADSIDIVIVSTAPIILPNRISRFCKTNGIKCIVDVQDVYPFAFLSAIDKRYHKIARIFLSPIEFIVRDTLSNASAVTSLSDNRLKQAMSMISNRSKITKALYLNFKGTPSYKDKELSQGVLKLVYIGQIGKSYDFETTLKALSIVKNESIKYTLDIFGHGILQKRWEKLAARLGLINVNFHGFVNFDDAKTKIQNCDIGLIPIAKNWPPCIPNKPIDYFGLGLPVLNSVSGELSHLISNNNLGFNYTAGDPQSLAQKLRQIVDQKANLNQMGYNGYLITKRLFMPDVIMSKFEYFIKNVVLS